MIDMNDCKPLLSDRDAFNVGQSRGDPLNGLVTMRSIALNVRDFYEAKIARGELMVVKTTTNKSGEWKCHHCRRYNGLIDERNFNFCPGCGAMIVK